MNHIEKITQLLEEYADCRDELSPQATARVIDALYRNDAEIADNLRDYWKHLSSGAEK